MQQNLFYINFSASVAWLFDSLNFLWTVAEKINNIIVDISANNVCKILALSVVFSSMIRMIWL